MTRAHGTLLAALALAGCTFQTPIPKERMRLPETAPQKLEMPSLGQPFEDRLDCDARDCNRWYRVDIVEPGVLDAVVVREGAASAPAMRVLMRPLGKPVLARTLARAGEPLSLSAPVTADVYLVLVQIGSGQQAYRLTLSFQPASATDRPKAQ